MAGVLPTTKGANADDPTKGKGTSKGKADDDHPMAPADGLWTPRGKVSELTESARKSLTQSAQKKNMLSLWPRSRPRAPQAVTPSSRSS